MRAASIYEIGCRLKILRIMLACTAVAVLSANVALCADAPVVPATNQSVPSVPAVDPVKATNNSAADPLAPPQPSNAENERQRWWLLGLMALLIAVAVLFRRRDKRADREGSP